MDTSAGAFEGVMVAESWGAPPASGWRARFCVDHDATNWSECRLLDISLTGAVLELDRDLPDESATGRPCSLQIDSIAEDEVGITMRAVVRDVEAGEGTPLVHIEFSARREERMLLHLLVRLHSLA